MRTEGRGAGTVDPPEWFRRAIAERPEHCFTELDGVPLHYRAWGAVGAPGILLLHGGGAHSGWWDHIGPLLATDRRVIASDLTGHGDSGRKPSYDRLLWADEVAAVLAAERFVDPVVIGHSMGGWISIFTAVVHPDAMSSIVVIDSPLSSAPPEETAVRHRLAPTRIYPTIEAALARFRTVPEQPNLLPFVVDHVARESLREVEGGWTWKFDPGIFADRARHRDLILELTVPMTFIRSENGLVPPEMLDAIVAQHRGGMRTVELPRAGHHAMLDEPLALVETLRPTVET